MALADLRRDYTTGTLERDGLDADPIAQFKGWFDQASAAAHAGGRWRRFAIGFYKAIQHLRGITSVEVNAMVLATVDAEGRPSARTVLLKGVDARGFVFFTNYESRKGRELAGNPNASLVFYWPDLERQVCASGLITKLSREESQAYFHSRPRGSQLGAWASHQSAPVPNRAALEDQFRTAEAKFAGMEIPLPEFWGGYVLRPERVEFWQGRASRMHDRFEYLRDSNGAWTVRRLNP
jgi:pyridoxamine 5'-phosphate oxidase